MNQLAQDACRRGAEWLLARLQNDGSLQGAADLTAYYKTPCALLWSGHPAQARKVLEYTRDHYISSEGELDATSVPWISQYGIYPHAWLACASSALDDAFTTRALTDYMESRWNPESGGFRARDDGSEEVMTTSMAGIACLRAGRMAEAAGVAKWLRAVKDQQPDLRAGLIHVFQPGKGLVEGDRSAAYVVDTSKPRQWYFQYGISAAFLANFSKLTGDADALRLAQEYLYASAHCASDVYQTPQSGKIGWGAVWTFALTRDPADEALITAVVDGLRALQCGDGSWNAEGVYQQKPTASDAARFDVTAEFVALLAQMGAGKIV